MIATENGCHYQDEMIFAQAGVSTRGLLPQAVSRKHDVEDRGTILARNILVNMLYRRCRLGSAGAFDFVVVRIC